MKVLYMLFALGFLSAYGFGQNPIDSLKLRSSQLPPGKEKMLALDKLCESITLSRKNLDQALLYADSLRWLSSKTGLKEAAALAELHTGVVSRHQANYQKALDHFLKYVAFYETTTDSMRMAEGYYQLGVAYQFRGDYARSLDAYQKGYRIYDGLKHDYYAACTLVGIGTIYKKQAHWDAGIEAFGKSIVLMTKARQKHGASMAMSNLADIYVSKRDFIKAEKYYKQVLQTAIELKNEWGIADDHDDLGDLKLLQQKYPEALGHYQKALAMRRKLGNAMSTSETLRNIGNLYLKTGNHQQAETYLVEAERLARQSAANPILQDIYLYLSEIKEKQGDHFQAYDYHKKYVAVKDSVMNDEVADKLNELQVKYESSEKDKQIDLLAQEKIIHEKEALRQAAINNMYIIGLAAALLAGGLIFYVFRQRLKGQQAMALKNDELKQEKFKTELRDLELKALRAQINPHFIFNCMNSINKMILSGENDNASVYLVKLSKLIRLILENAESDEVQLRNELDLLKSYVELEQLRFKNKIAYDIHIAPEIDLESTYIPSMILQPFVENAIWHGLLHREDSYQGKIEILVGRDDANLLFTIEDNGIGREKSQQLKAQSVAGQKSMGLKITEERLRLIAKPDAREVIRFEDLKNLNGSALGTRVIILLPEFQESA